MIIDCISDLHGEYPKLDGGDLLIVAGDLTAWDTSKQHEECIEWLIAQKYKRIVLIAGNHDGHIQRGDLPRYDEGIDYLQDSGTEFEGMKIWGSPWQRQFPFQNPKFTAFSVNSDATLGEKWDLIPKDIDILVTHTPPESVLDRTWRAKRTGCPYLYSRLLEIKPKLHVFGHIHEGYGKHEIDHGNDHKTICVNAAHMNADYDAINKPIRIVLE